MGKGSQEISHTSRKDVIIHLAQHQAFPPAALPAQRPPSQCLLLARLTTQPAGVNKDIPSGPRHPAGQSLTRRREVCTLYSSLSISLTRDKDSSETEASFNMAHLKVLTPVDSNLSDLLGPLPTEEGLLDEIEDPVETSAWMVLRRRVEEEVRQNTHNSIVFPPLLLDQVAEHVLDLAKDEPCGLRGCVLFVVYEDPELGELQLAKMKADKNMPSTHLLVLKLKADPTSWFTKMARIFRSLGKRKMVVSPRYELLKKNFYDDPQDVENHESLKYEAKERPGKVMQLSGLAVSRDGGRESGRGWAVGRGWTSTGCVRIELITRLDFVRIGRNGEDHEARGGDPCQPHKRVGADVTRDKRPLQKRPGKREKPSQQKKTLNLEQKTGVTCDSSPGRRTGWSKVEQRPRVPRFASLSRLDTEGGVASIVFNLNSISSTLGRHLYLRSCSRGEGVSEAGVGCYSCWNNWSSSSRNITTIITITTTTTITISYNSTSNTCSICSSSSSSSSSSMSMREYHPSRWSSGGVRRGWGRHCSPAKQCLGCPKEPGGPLGPGRKVGAKSKSSMGPPPRPFKKARYAWEIKNYEHTVSNMTQSLGGECSVELQDDSQDSQSSDVNSDGSQEDGAPTARDDLPAGGLDRAAFMDPRARPRPDLMPPIMPAPYPTTYGMMAAPRPLRPVPRPARAPRRGPLCRRTLMRASCGGTRGSCAAASWTTP
ncbi:hypothetical protein O3P69_005551 [Scylla paramamosain]|uniref:Uncharacterized protein n=1 Tax=Scylla paramamosain TaxID=85552 RepID=A0AAW0U8C1_SCYPA